MKSRHNLYFEEGDWKFFSSLAKEKRKSVSELITYAMKHTFKDPLQRLLEEERALYRKIKVIDDKKKVLMSKKDDEDAIEAFII